jgi:hypothetical protein
MERDRLVAFSDGVIAVIITIMVLELKAPHEASLGALQQAAAVFLSYVLSFVYVGIYWSNHHHMLYLSRFWLVDQRLVARFYVGTRFGGARHDWKIAALGHRGTTRRADGSGQLPRSWRGRPCPRRAADTGRLDQSTDRRGIRCA